MSLNKGMSETECNETNIGILVVHGIGDQKQFDCLKGIANEIVNCFQSEIEKGYVEVSVDINQADIGTFKETYPSWENGKKSPINVRIRPNGYKKTYNLHLREVWWADIDRPQNFGKFIKFWLWGLSLWATSLEANFPILNDPDDHLKGFKPVEDKKDSFRIWARCEYFIIGIFLLVCQPLLFLIKSLLRFFDFNIPLTIIADYVGKLRLYSDSSKAEKELIEDRDNSPRFSIQRRMINALVRMAISDYDRWYVWSHSLGSIVAYNGFSMPEATLSHYVSHSMWEEIEEWESNTALNHNNSLLEEISNHNSQRPKPYRPVWQNKRISREALFEKCKGLVTYGSPFWRIADLWTDLVKRNTQADFSADFRWYNIIDPSDPVATRIKELFLDDPSVPGQPQSLHPEDVFYRTPKPFLLAHMEYLSEKENSLIGQLWRWMSEARTITEQNNLYDSWYVRFSSEVLKKQDKRIAYLRYHQIWRFLWWILLIALVLFLPFYIAPIWNKIPYWCYVIACLLPTIISAGILLLINGTKRVSSIVRFCSILLSPLILFLGASFTIYLADKRYSEDKVVEYITNYILENRPWITPFLWSTLFVGIVLVVGLIFAYRGRNVKSLILEYLQNYPNQRFTQKDLTDKFRSVDAIGVTNALSYLVENKEIRKDDSTGEYFFPFYNFELSTISYEFELLSANNSELIHKLQKIEIETSHELCRCIIDLLKFDPTKEIIGRNYIDRENEIYYLALDGTDILIPYQIDYNSDTICPSFVFLN